MDHIGYEGEILANLMGFITLKRLISKPWGDLISKPKKFDSRQWGSDLRYRLFWPIVPCREPFVENTKIYGNCTQKSDLSWKTISMFKE